MRDDKRISGGEEWHFSHISFLSFGWGVYLGVNIDRVALAKLFEARHRDDSGQGRQRHSHGLLFFCFRFGQRLNDNGISSVFP